MRAPTTSSPVRSSRVRACRGGTPAFATLGNGEIDFYVKTIKAHKSYAIEVNAGKKNSKTIQAVLEHNKADFILFAKGNTHGGIADKVYTIPIYGIGKFKF